MYISATKLDCINLYPTNISKSIGKIQVNVTWKYYCVLQAH